MGFGLLFFGYLLFQFVQITLAFIISFFFQNSKKAIIFGIVFYVLTMFSWLQKDNVRNKGPGAVKFLQLSPIANVSFIVQLWINFQSNFLPFGAAELSTTFINFQAKNFYSIMVVELVVLQIVAHVLYLVFGSSTISEWWSARREKRKLVNMVSNSRPQEPQPNDNFEPAVGELKEQAANKQVVSFSNINKIFGERRAVSEFSLEIFTGQIFVLLGHNGAGKTTLISMLAGLYPPTTGSISVLGHDSESDRERIKLLLGICPQKNPIVPYLTVREHLALYVGIKRAPEDAEYIDQLMRDIDLYHKRDSVCATLSGGQKRKLCIALSFVGQSKVIILDEPTSGMDTYARRFMWDMLKKYKKDKIIILTTHNMDEAEYLGDRIAIMNQGKLVTLGSAMFLKKKYNVGYILTLVKGDKGAAVEEITQKMSEFADNLAPPEVAGKELKYKLGFTQTSSYPPSSSSWRTTKKTSEWPPSASPSPRSRTSSSRRRSTTKPPPSRNSTPPPTTRSPCRSAS